MLEFFKTLLFGRKCHKCNKGRIKLIGRDRIGFVDTNVYECNNCYHKFI